MVPASSITTLSPLIRARRMSPVTVVQACLERIADRNPQLNAFITILADDALSQARDAEAEIQAGKWRGPLHGIPVGIKDFYDTAGIRTTAAFARFRDRTPAQDAVGVTRLKAAGAIIVGKTNMHQLGMGTTGLESHFGPMRNPWNAEHIAGGSSGGSAAAVASGMCFATLDTDAIGSCRLPAACCGVVGFKGTYGLLSTSGILDGEDPPDEAILWLSHAAVTTRSVADAALVVDALAGRAFAAGLAEERSLRVGVANNFKADGEVGAVFEQAVEAIGRLGYPLTSAAAPFSDPALGVSKIEADRKSIGERAFKEIDLLLLPTTTTTVPTIQVAGADPLALSPANTAFANYYALPAISIPCGVDTRGLPLGLQIVGKAGDDASVLQLAYRYEGRITRTA